MLTFFCTAHACQSMRSTSLWKAEMKCLGEYINVAEQLIKQGYYSRLLEVIIDTWMIKHTFIVLDCPSGTGKTQTGIALLVMAKMKFKISNRPLIVAHIVWESSVDSQDIYQAIEEYQTSQSINVRGFYTRAKHWLEMPDRIPTSKKDANSYKEHVWKHFLKHVFLDESIETLFLNGKGLFALTLDEIPVEPADLALIGELRDALKIVREIVIILSGTNSMAANMIGLSSNKASYTVIQRSGDCWSYVVTRMPKFLPESSPYFEFWSEVKNTKFLNDEVQRVINAIATSIHGNGNPRLINTAIAALQTVYSKATAQKPFSFDDWQAEFANINILGKFAVIKWKDGAEILKAQANLLLAATCYAPLADTMIHGHYGQRAFPDGGKYGCCSLTSEMKECGGWLKICSTQWRCLGKSLYYGNMAVGEVTSSAFDWQVSVFQPVRDDILLYLGSCWSVGYFAVFRRDHEDKHRFSVETFTTMQILEVYWQSNMFGSLNFQNPSAPINKGAMAEVLVAFSVMNAAAMSKNRDFYTFFRLFLSQMHITGFDLPPEMLADKALQGIHIPRHIFPGTESDCKIENIGILERSISNNYIDVILHGVDGRNGLDQKVEKLYFEAK